MAVYCFIGERLCEAVSGKTFDVPEDFARETIRKAVLNTGEISDVPPDWRQYWQKVREERKRAERGIREEKLSSYRKNREREEREFAPRRK